MLKKQYDEKLAQKEELRKRSEEMELKLERAGMLVSGLAGEKARWEETVQVTWVVPVVTALPRHSRGLSQCPLRDSGWGKQGYMAVENREEKSLPFSRLMRKYREWFPDHEG